MNFYIGQKVVCIYDGPMAHQDPHTDWDVGAEIRNGVVYTVRSLGTTFQSKGPGVRLIGLKNQAGDYPYLAARFRPVVERKTETGMAILREILDRETHHDKPPVRASRTEDTIGTAQRE